MKLVTYEIAKEHLKLSEDAETADLERKIATATAMVLIFIDRVENDWSETTDPTTDLEFALVQGAILDTVGDLFRNRGDEPEREVSNAVEAGAYLRPNVRRKLMPLRMPSLA